MDLGRLPDCRWFAGFHLEETLHGGRLYLCKICGLKYRFPLLDGGVYTRLYKMAAQDVWESGEQPRKDFDLIAKTIRNHYVKDAAILDFGCYAGELLTRLDSKHTKYGVEINHAAATTASQRINGQIWSSLDEIPNDVDFDVVIASDVIEHLSDPSKTIGDLAEKVKENGLLIITTGDAQARLWKRFKANWWYCFYPEHITFFSIAAIRLLARRHGLSLVHSETFRHAQLSIIRRVFACGLACWCGYFPKSYYWIAKAFRKMVGRSADLSGLPGNGATNDHLLAVLKKSSDASA